MIQPILDNLTAAIRALIEHHEELRSHQLPKDELDFLIESYSVLVQNIVDGTTTPMENMLRAQFSTQVNIPPRLDRLRDAIKCSGFHNALDPERIANMIDCLAVKYVTGSIEHSDSPFFEINFTNEINNEILDLFHYEYGRQHIRTKRAVRV